MSQSNLSEGFKDNEKTRRNIKKNLVIFISDSIALFKELIQMKNGTTNQAPNKKAPIKNNKVSESVETSPVINEHINRIKKRTHFASPTINRDIANFRHWPSLVRN